jgi:sterol desaturase/sphingolipid hydroxylase (fatty acid hydroxylase superfamily)
VNATFFACWIAILAFDGVLMASLTWAADSARYGKYRIRTPQTYEIPRTRKIVNTQLNNTLSLAIFGAYFYFLGDRTLVAGWPGITRLLGETLGVLLLYDFMYYFFHRGMHHPKVMKYVHGVHHFVRFPTSDESIYLHPAETLGGLGLLVLSIVILGPISAVSFLLVFFFHSTINIIVHSNLVFPHPAFRLFNFWTRSHDVHHHKVRYNYASIFPFWDQAFGTYRLGGTNESH